MQLAMKPACAFLALGVVAFAVACNAVSSSSGSFGGSFSASGTAGSAGSASTSFVPPDCPTTVPEQGAACSGSGVCELGGAVDPACNVIARCNADGFWEIETPTRCPQACPAHFDDRAPGDPCSGPDVCTYLEATCGCAGAIADAGLLVPPDAEVPDAAEGGALDGGPSAPDGRWQCVRPGNGCPARHPVAQASCSADLACDYGTCLFGVPLTYRCDGLRWLEPSGSCP